MSHRSDNIQDHIEQIALAIVNPVSYMRHNLGIVIVYIPPMRHFEREGTTAIRKAKVIGILLHVMVAWSGSFFIRAPNTPRRRTSSCSV